MVWCVACGVCMYPISVQCVVCSVQVQCAVWCQKGVANVKDLRRGGRTGRRKEEKDRGPEEEMAGRNIDKTKPNSFVGTRPLVVLTLLQKGKASPSLTSESSPFLLCYFDPTRKRLPHSPHSVFLSPNPPHDTLVSTYLGR